MMFGLRHENSGPVYGALVDISSGSVGVAIVASFFENKLPILLYTHRTMLRITKHELSKDDGLRKVQEALLSASLILSQDGTSALKQHDEKARISKLYVTCSSPWAFTIARSAHLTEETEFKVTQSVISDLIHSAEEEILQHLEKEALMSEKGFEVVEQATVDITINDYPVKDPINLKGKSLGLSHIAGLIPKEIIDSITEVQNKIFPSTTLRSHTYMLVMYCVMRELFPRSHSLCIIDITGEATEFGLVENNLLIENSYVPYGSNTFIRDMMSKTNKPESDISTSIHSFGDTTDLIPATFTDEASVFESHIVASLTSILERRSVPVDVIITVHRPYEHFFKHIIETAFTKAVGKTPNVITLEPAIIDEISHGAGDDVYLALGARFFHKLHGCGELNDT